MTNMASWARLSGIRRVLNYSRDHAAKNIESSFPRPQLLPLSIGLRHNSSVDIGNLPGTQIRKNSENGPKFVLNTEKRTELSKLYHEKGLNAMREIARLVQYTTEQDLRLKRNYEEAQQALQLAIACDKENHEAMIALAQLHLSYIIPGLSTQTGEALLYHCADCGVDEAQYMLGCHLRKQADSEEEPRLMERSFEYLNMAANQGHSGALFLLGIAHYVGESVIKDVQRAIDYLKQAAEKGHKGAATACGAILVKGLNPSSSREVGPASLEAIRLFEKSSELGDQLADSWLQKLGTEIPASKN